MSTAANFWQSEGTEPSEPEHDLEDYSVDQLKDLLRERDLPVSGNKAELIERLRENK